MHTSGLLGLFGGRQARVRAKLHDRGVIARQVVAQNTTQIQTALAPRSTTLYYTGPRALLAKLEKA